MAARRSVVTGCESRVSEEPSEDEVMYRTSPSL